MNKINKIQSRNFDITLIANGTVEVLIDNTTCNIWKRNQIIGNFEGFLEFPMEVHPGTRVTKLYGIPFIDKDVLTIFHGLNRVSK